MKVLENEPSPLQEQQKLLVVEPSFLPSIRQASWSNRTYRMNLSKCIEMGFIKAASMLWFNYSNNDSLSMKTLRIK